MPSGLATYYERLGRWNRAARAIGYGGGSTTLTVHRALADPAHGGRPSFTRLHDLLLESLPPLVTPRVLDAGCGLGGTMLALATALEAECVGITLSPTQAQTANRAAAHAGMEGRVRAQVGNYDVPPAGPFGLVVAIESLAHSPDPARSVRALASVLAPGGRLAIVDDMPEAAAAGTADLASFKRGWECPVLWAESEYLSACAREGLVIERQRDLTPESRPRALWRIWCLMRLNRMARLLPSAALRQVMDSHFGGLALERLTRAGLVRYRLLIARKP